MPSDVTGTRRLEDRIDRMNDRISDTLSQIQKLEARQGAGPTFEQVANIRSDLENRFATILETFSKSMSEKLGNERSAVLAEVDKMGADIRSMLKEEVSRLGKDLSDELHKYILESLPGHVAAIVETREDKRWAKFKARLQTIGVTIGLIVMVAGWVWAFMLWVKAGAAGL